MGRWLRRPCSSTATPATPSWSSTRATRTARGYLRRHCGRHATRIKTICCGTASLRSPVGRLVVRQCVLYAVLVARGGARGGTRAVATSGCATLCGSSELPNMSACLREPRDFSHASCSGVSSPRSGTPPSGKRSLGTPDVGAPGWAALSCCHDIGSSLGSYRLSACLRVEVLVWHLQEQSLPILQSPWSFSAQAPERLLLDEWQPQPHV